MAGLPRPKAAGHLSSCVLAAQPQRQERSLEGPPKSHGGTWAYSEKRKVCWPRPAVLTPHGNPARCGDRDYLGRLGFSWALRPASHWDAAIHVVHAISGVGSSHACAAVARRSWASRGRFRLAALVFGPLCRLLERRVY